jgi:hypothetical protein
MTATVTVTMLALLLTVPRYSPWRPLLRATMPCNKAPARSFQYLHVLFLSRANYRYGHRSFPHAYPTGRLSTLKFGISLPSLTAHVQVLVPSLVCSS